MFGTNVPKLMKMITEELELDEKYRKGEAQRIFYALDELLPEELERLEEKTKAEEVVRKAEEIEAKRQRKEYLTHVTNEIIAHITDIGCTIFMPNIGRDIYKKLGDPSEKFELTAKERKITNIPKEHREILFLNCPNPIDEKVLDFVLKKDVIINAWKLAEGELRTPEDILKEFVGLLTNKQAILDDGGNPIPDAFEKELIEPFTVPGGDVTVPGCWTPHNRTTNAAIIYLYFRSVSLDLPLLVHTLHKLIYFILETFKKNSSQITFFLPTPFLSHLICVVSLTPTKNGRLQICVVHTRKMSLHWDIFRLGIQIVMNFSRKILPNIMIENQLRESIIGVFFY